MTRSHYAYTRRWLEQRFAATDADGVFIAHMPIYGHGDPHSEVGRLPRLARVLQILRALARTEFATLLDVGGAEGFTPWVVRQLFDADVLSVDLSLEACRRAADLFAVDGCACDADRLPFPDGSFDVVLCSETIEHVEYPLHVILELQRVARRAVILTTEEISSRRAEIDAWLADRSGYPHGERNRFHADDLRAAFGAGVELWTQYSGQRPDEQLSDDDAREWLRTATPDVRGLRGIGVVAVRWLDPAARLDTPRLDKETLVDRLLAATVPVRPLVASRAATPPPSVLSRVVCPLDGTPLRVEGRSLVSQDGRRYAIQDGIAELHARPWRTPSRDELEQRIDHLLPDRPERRRRLLALHDALWIPESPDRTEWRFERSEDTLGWRIGDQLEQRAATGPGLHLRSTGDDPDLVGPTMPFATADIVAFEIDLRVRNPAFGREDGVGQLFWMTADDATFREDASVTFPVINDGEVHRYVVDPRDGRGWPPDADLVCARLDPINGPCELDLMRFAIRLRLPGLDASRDPGT